MSDSKNLVRKMFVGRNATSEAVMFAVKETKAGNEVDSADVVGSTVQVNYYVNEVPVKESTIKLKVEVDPNDNIELFDADKDVVTSVHIEKLPDPVEVVTQSVEDIAEVIEKTEEPDVLVPDWGYAESLEDKADVEAYLAEFGFNATSTWKKSTMIKKAKEHFGE